MRRHCHSSKLRSLHWTRTPFNLSQYPKFFHREHILKDMCLYDAQKVSLICDIRFTCKISFPIFCNVILILTCLSSHYTPFKVWHKIIWFFFRGLFVDHFKKIKKYSAFFLVYSNCNQLPRTRSNHEKFMVNHILKTVRPGNDRIICSQSGCFQ